MIIYLQEELIEKCQLSTATPQRVEFFENLAIARRDGKHLIIGDRSVFEHLQELIGLSTLAKAIYRLIFNRFSIEFTKKPSDILIFKIGFQNLIRDNEIQYNIDDLLDSSFCSYNNLLVENPFDTFIFDKIINYYKVNRGLNNAEYFWDIRNGGGTTSHPEFNRLKLLKTNYTFAVLDSDKICPASNFGETARPFDDDHPSVYGSYHILTQHEIENLIPSSVYKLYIESTGDGQLHRNIGILDLNSEIIHYIDFKKGIKKYGIYNSQHSTRQFYLEQLNLTDLDLECECNSKNTCNCYIFYPMSRSIYSQVKNFVEENNIEILDHINNQLESTYLDLGKKMFEVFCKFNRIVSH